MFEWEETKAAKGFLVQCIAWDLNNSTVVFGRRLHECNPLVFWECVKTKGHQLCFLFPENPQQVVAFSRLASSGQQDISLPFEQ